MNIIYAYAKLCLRAAIVSFTIASASGVKALVSRTISPY